MTLTVKQDRRQARIGRKSRRYVAVTVNAPAGATDKPRSPVNIGFVIDRSGSMTGEKLRLATQAVAQALELLKPDDRFAIVSYDDVVNVVVPGVDASPSERAKASKLIKLLEPGGSTNLCEGWLTGCRLIAEALDEARLGRCLLLTDGLANVGETDPGSLAHHARELQLRGVSTSTFGVGADFDEGLLGQIANAGAGSFYFVDTPSKIPDLISRELGDALDVVARDVVLEMSAPEGTSVDVIGPYILESSGSSFRVELPDLVSNQVLTFPMRITLPAEMEGQKDVRVSFNLDDRAHVLESAVSDVSFRYSSDHENDVQSRDREVDHLVADRYAAIARIQAIQLTRDDQSEKGRDLLLEVAQTIKTYAQNDSYLIELTLELEKDAYQFANMNAMESKFAHHMSGSMYSSSTPEGFRRRSVK